jgi:predicted DNA-binding transcriptional regulator YafY
VDDLATELDVTKRTIWRDMEALQAVGFPLTSEKDGRRTRWKLMNAPFKGLADLNISMLELASLYMGRAMVDGMAGAPFGAALGALITKVGKRSRPGCVRISTSCQR